MRDTKEYWEKVAKQAFQRILDQKQEIEKLKKQLDDMKTEKEIDNEIDLFTRKMI